MPSTRYAAAAQAVVDYWIDEVGAQSWYAGSEDLDAQIRDRFLPLWQEADAGRLDLWQSMPVGSLAFILLTDQFSRNIFRDDPRAFATDARARKAAGKAIHQGWDLRTPEPQRQFFYLPLMHSENNVDQDRCVRLVLTRMPETGASNLLHARAHRAVIRQFGRFPHRNDALGRITTDAEAAYMKEGGYGQTVRALEAA